MVIPKFWAEARVQRRAQGKQVTVRRFGWSDVGQDEAERHARERADDALQRILRGEHLARSEPKVPYNGADGMPIREEILDRYGDVIITRNAYGAHCLNTPDVLFADIDFEIDPPSGAPVSVILVLCLLAAGAAFVMHSWLPVVVAILVVIPLAIFIASRVNAARTRDAAGGYEERAMANVNAYADAHPDWHLLVYRTPAGLRVLAAQRTFEPREQAVLDFFEALRVDQAYTQMCTLQNCFRARVSPKPWRIGIHENMRPRPGVWPLREDQLARRREWTDKYEALADGYASCRFVCALGNGVVDAKAELVRELHDGLSRSNSGLPIA